MGKIVKPYKYDDVSFLSIQQNLLDTIAQFKGRENSFNAIVDAEVVEWLGKYENNDAICADLQKFVKGLPLGDSREDGERRGDLQRFVEAAMELRKTITEMKAADPEETRQKNLKFIGDTLDVLRGDAEHPGLAETLAEYHKATGFRYADSKEFKLLNLLAGQVDECVGWFEYTALRQLDDDIPERVRMQNECIEGIPKYNKEAEDFVIHAMNVLNLQENSIDGYYYKQQVKAEVAQHRVKQAESEIKRLDALFDQKAQEIAALEEDLGKENELESAFKEDVALKKEMFDERVAQMDENYVPKIPTAIDLNNQEKERLIKELQDKEAEVKTLWENYENALHELNNKSQNFDQDIDREQYGKNGVNINNPNFTNEQLANVPKIREAEQRMKHLNTKETILNGQVSFTEEQTDALIEALRTEKDTDIEKLSSFKNGMMLSGYYGVLKEYAKAYDVRHEGEPPVEIKGKDFFSYARMRSVGIKAAIDLLNSTIQTNKKVAVLPLSVALRNGAGELESSLNHFVNDNKPLANAVRLQEEKEKFIQKQTETIKEHKEKYDKSVLERTRMHARNSNALKELAFTNYDESKKTPEQIKAEKEEARKIAENEYKEAQTKYAEYQKRVEGLKAKLDAATKEKAALPAEKDKWERKLDALKADQKFQAAEFEKMEKDIASLRQQKTAISEKIETLYKTKEVHGQKDGRMEYAAEKINFFLKHAEDGNPEKSPGKREHTNGSHYKALEKELTTLSEDLKKGGMTNNDLAKRLQTLRDVADSYLEARSHDFWPKVTGGSQFRHNRLAFATAICGFCQTWQSHLLRDMAQTNKEAEEKLALNKKEELLPEPLFENFGKFHYGNEKSEDQYTVVDDNLELDLKNFQHFKTDDEIEKERQAIEFSKAHDKEQELNPSVWDRDTDLDIEQHANDPKVPQNIDDNYVVKEGNNRQDALDAPADDDTESVYTKFEDQYFEAEDDRSIEINNPSI